MASCTPGLRHNVYVDTMLSVSAPGRTMSSPSTLRPISVPQDIVVIVKVVSMHPIKNVCVLIVPVRNSLP